MCLYDQVINQLNSSNHKASKPVLEITYSQNFKEFKTFHRIMKLVQKVQRFIIKSPM